MRDGEGRAVDDSDHRVTKARWSAAIFAPMRPSPRLALFVSALAFVVVSCGDDDVTPPIDAGSADTGTPDLGVPDNTNGGDPTGVTLSGDAIPFTDGPDGRVSGAFIYVLERPELHMTTGPDGHFEFTGLAIGSEISLRLQRARYAPIQTGTVTLGDAGAERVTFQAVSTSMYNALAAIVEITPDPTRCQLVTTVTRIGRSVYDTGAHGEADVVVTIDPPLPAEHGPVYFNASVVPERTLTMTSDDGGVLYTNVPPGTYTLTGTKAGAVFTTVKAKCEAGWLVNASPPWGLQRTM